MQKPMSIFTLARRIREPIRSAFCGCRLRSSSSSEFAALAIIYAKLSMTLPYRFRSGFPAYAVELNGIEPMTSGLQSPRSPS